MGAKIKNNAYGTLLSSIAPGDTAITLSSGQGANFPSLSTGEYFYATLINTSNTLEIVKVTGRTGDVLTVVRAQEGTVARTYVVGDRIEIRITAALLNEKADKAGDTFTSPIIADKLRFNTSPAPTGLQPGDAWWSADDGTLNIRLKGGNVTLQVGQEQVHPVYNDTGATLLEKQVVHVSGAFGGMLTVALAQADSEAASASTFAVVTENIGTMSSGFVTTNGLVRNVDTSMYPVGSALYLDPLVAGGITSSKPAAPYHMVLVGWCVKSHATEGMIFVHVQNGYELDELHNVAINSVQDLDFLQYDAGSSVWRNKKGVDTSDDHIRIRASKTPLSSTDTGETGTICWDVNYIYVCVATNSWIRVPKATSTW